MSEHIPAWKRIGLLVKQDLDNDPLALTTHISSEHITNKEIKKIAKQKRKLILENDVKTKKPPKRVKLPKQDRPPPPEPDQLVYLKQFAEDRANWKFSKQKQNWILRNIRFIPKTYDSSLSLYLDGMQGSSRTRIVDDLKRVCQKWNELAEIAEKNVEKQLAGESETKESEDKEEKPKEKPKKKPDPKDEDPDYDYALKCKRLIAVLTEENVELKGIVEEDAAENVVETPEQAPGAPEESPDAEEESTEVSEAPEASSSATAEQEDNLIIEEVNADKFKEGSSVKIIEGYAEDEPTEAPKEPKAKKSKSKKSKSKKPKA